ncbi:MAG: 4-hydroxythreonine-4-phosphate dehydrogenase PdxA, partial [Proteobacteria bacterium]
MERTRTRVAITLGDPAGIGPEISLKAMKAFASDVSGKDFSLVLVGAQPCIKRIANQLDFDVELTDAPDATWPRITVADIDVASAAIEDGVGTATTGLHSYKAVYTAVQMALSGDIDAICTAPLSKEALNAAGYHYSGHTELLAKLTGATDTCMMLVHDGLHVSHMSTHVALSSAAKYVTPERLRRVVGLTDVALRNLGVVSPRIAVCALKPHAGEAGL